MAAEVSTPPDRLLQVAEKIEKEKLFKAEHFCLPGRQLSKGSQYPGLIVPLPPWFYRQIIEGRIAKDADCLPPKWIILDVSRRPDYDGGKQMYQDSEGLGDILADLRGQGKVEVPDCYRRVLRNSRFAVSADEIDGKGGFVANAVASVLSLQAGEQVTTSPYVVFNYIGNLAYPEFGQANTLEWFADEFWHGYRLAGGLACVGSWRSGFPDDYVGFRLQISFPSLVQER